jgi:exosome complex component RRP43
LLRSAQEFHRKFLQHSVRPDGRSLTGVRPTLIASDSISSSSGSSLVKVGNTSVVCALKLEVGKPFDTRPQDGRLSVEVHLGPLCSPKFKATRATESSVALSQWLTNAVVKSVSFFLQTAGGRAWAASARRF